VSERIELTVNGKAMSYEGDPMARLLDVLRGGFGLTGTKEGCGEGECGACTVWLDDEVVCACLVPVLQAAGRRVTTIEGLSEKDLDVLQRAFIDEAAVQCGACTPGMIMAAHALLRRHPQPTAEQIREHLAGNLCRCTGYQSIVRAVGKAAGSGA
jgi:aerobic-type carbon monoxide dehydrogenase small subunit (CoxS/CutS family)